MKRLILFLVILINSLAIYSQPFGDTSPVFKIIQLNYENSTGEKGTTYFKYDRENRISKALWTLDNKSRHSENKYQYDSKGNLVAAFRDFSDGLTSFEYFNYDSLGNKTSEYFYRSDSVNGYASYQYNGGRLVKADFHNYKGWLNGVLKLQYNNENKKEKGTLFKEDKVVCEISYDYDRGGNLSKEFWDFNKKWSQTFVYVYEKKNLDILFYSSPYFPKKSNFRISHEDYTYNNEVGGPSYYYYNEQELLDKKVFVRSDSITTSTSYNYDIEGKLVSSMRNNSDSSIIKFDYVYDKNNNLIARNYFKEGTNCGFESYLYNSDGELIKAYLKNADGWITGTINFQSDELGDVTGGEFKGENGFNASLIFSYNSDGLLSEIMWNFSFGKFQRYNFEYEHF